MHIQEIMENKRNVMEWILNGRLCKSAEQDGNPEIPEISHLRFILDSFEPLIGPLL